MHDADYAKLPKHTRPDPKMHQDPRKRAIRAADPWGANARGPDAPRNAMLLLTALPTVLGCSFLVTRGVTFDEQQLRYANELNRLRGPDLTTHRELGGTHIIHNLLWLTGTPTPQPFMDANAQVAAPSLSVGRRPTLCVHLH